MKIIAYGLERRPRSLEEAFSPGRLKANSELAFPMIDLPILVSRIDKTMPFLKLWCILCGLRIMGKLDSFEWLLVCLLVTMVITGMYVGWTKSADKRPADRPAVAICR